MSSTVHSKYLILGAGPTGLGAARQLEKSGEASWSLLEASDHAGGLASSFVDDHGFTWDIGGHVQFSHYDYFDDAMREFLGRDGWLHHERESWVWMRDRFIPYPLQNNLHRLPPDDMYRCLDGLIDITKSPRPAPKNFAQWIDAKFGPGLADVFMTPYNFKVWAFPPEEMNAGWVGERVAVTDLSRVIRNLVYNQDEYSWGPNSTFQFPAKGGTGAIWTACAARLPLEKLRYGSRVTAIDLDARKVMLGNGESHSYERLISTIPLTELITLSGQSQLQDAAARGLKFSASNIVGLGLRDRPAEPLANKCWMYFPEDDCPFYRVTVFSNYSPANVPDPANNWSLMAEVSQSSAKPLDRETVVEDVIQGALNTGLIQSRDEIISTWSYHAPYGYPTPGVHRDEALAQIVPHFEAFDVYTRGRFGMWKYEVSNQDHSFMQGVEIVERLVNGRIEITAFDAEHVNAAKHPWPYERWSVAERPDHG